MPKYRITGGPDGTAGLNYKTKRVEPGDVVDDIPRDSIKWLREQGYIETIGKDDAIDDVVEPTVDEPVVEEPIADTPATDPADDPAPTPEV